MQGYGIPKGSRKPTINERRPSRGRTRDQIQDAYDRLEEAKRVALREAARFIRVSGVNEGDPISSELRELRTKVRILDSKMAVMASDYPWLAK